MFTPFFMLDTPFLGELGPFERFDPFFPLPLPLDFPLELPDLDGESRRWTPSGEATTGKNPRLTRNWFS